MRKSPRDGKPSTTGYFRLKGKMEETFQVKRFSWIAHISKLFLVKRSALASAQPSALSGTIRSALASPTVPEAVPADCDLFHHSLGIECTN